MDMTRLTLIVTLLVGLSMAAERFVEIVKGVVPFLDQPHPVPTIEGRRRAILQVLAVIAGILTVLFAGPMIPTDVYNATTPLGIFTLGLLASGGSSFWNSVLTFAISTKDLRRFEAAAKKEDVAGLSPGSHRDLDLGPEQVTSNECYDVEEG